MASFRTYVFLSYFLVAAAAGCSDKPSSIRDEFSHKTTSCNVNGGGGITGDDDACNSDHHSSILGAAAGFSAEPQDLIFPQGFMFGAATAAYQVEGGWNASDKSASIWDVYTHKTPSPVIDGSTGDVSCDSYHQWKQDVQLAKDLGLHFYRFSLSWTRLLPSGFDNHISEDGANYYNNLINELLKNGIQPMITIYHWDLPQRLSNLGGWTNPQVAEWFGDYARVAYSLFGDRVKYWITINEPLATCVGGYSLADFAPGFADAEVGYYLCVKHSILAHAKAYRIYDEEFRHKFNGKVSISNHQVWYEPKSEADQEITELFSQYANGLYTHPIFSKNGGWPPIVEDFYVQKSRDEGYSRSRLPAFTDEEIKLIQGTHDYYAFNLYTSRQIRKADPGEIVGVFPFEGAPDMDAVTESKPEWNDSASFWLKVHPVGIRNHLNWIKREYGDLEIVITENGYSTPNDGSFGLKDDARVSFYKDYLAQVLKAIKEDKVNVIGYTAWTLVDNFEWTEGYTKQFGLYAVDFNDPERRRVPRDSARFYSQVIKENNNAHNRKCTQ